MRKIPMRKCLATQERLPKKELIRIVRTPQGDVIVDETGKANGRGGVDYAGDYRNYDMDFICYEKILGL